MNPKLRGTICGVAAAVFYGTNPLGAMNLYADGITANSTLFYRFGLAALMLAVMMLVQRKSFALTRRELITLVALGILMGSSSSSLYISFNHMDVGIASTLLFVYPVLVAIIMAALFKEKVTAASVEGVHLIVRNTKSWSNAELRKKCKIQEYGGYTGTEEGSGTTGGGTSGGGTEQGGSGTTGGGTQEGGGGSQDSGDGLE